MPLSLLLLAEYNGLLASFLEEHPEGKQQFDNVINTILNSFNNTDPKFEQLPDVSKKTLLIELLKH